MRGDLGLAKEQRALADSLAESRGTQVTELKVRDGISLLLHVDTTHAKGPSVHGPVMANSWVPICHGRTVEQCSLVMTAP
jgi:hypothetical protein